MNDPSIEQFLRAAQQRLTAARVLFDNGLYLDAMYLAGYVPECSLKALLLSFVPARERRSFLRRQFRGAVAHSVEHLLAQLRRRKVSVSEPAIIAIRKTRAWTSELRYASGLMDRKEAWDFIVSTELILKWVSGRL